MKTYGNTEGPGKASDRVGDLIGKLDVVVVEPASRNLSEPVEASNASLSEERSQQIADNTTDTVSGKDLLGEGKGTNKVSLEVNLKHNMARLTSRASS